MVRQINQNEFTKVINRDITTIVYFSHDGASQADLSAAAAVERVSKGWSDKKVEFVRLDIGANEIYKVEGARDVMAPSFIAFVNGQPVCELWQGIGSTRFGTIIKLRNTRKNVKPTTKSVNTENKITICLQSLTPEFAN